MNKRKIDLHGIRLSDVDKILDSLIIDALANGGGQIEVITGRGILQDTIIDKCKKLYNYNARTSINNSGVIVIDLEN